MPDGGPFARIDWKTCLNVGSKVIPPFSLVQCQDTDADDSDRIIVHKVDQFATTFGREFMVTRRTPD